VQGFRTVDDLSTGWKVGLGWQFRPRWSLDLTWADLGSAHIENVDPDIALEGDIDYRAPSLAVSYRLRPSNKRLNVFLKAGVAAIMNRSSESWLGFDKQRDAQLALGAGMVFHPRNQPFFGRIEVDSYDRDAWYAGLAVGTYLTKRRP
jgi:hypothetical protein